MSSNEDYESMLEAVRLTLTGAIKQNEMLIKVLKYYADDRWWRSREIPMMDRGEKARKTLQEIIG